MIRVGVLGAARIAPKAIVDPAADRADVEIVAVAARDRGRAEAFAHKHGIPDVENDYESVIVRDDLDLVYVPLPNGLHLDWATRALDAGRHVLCEKPITANADEAAELIDCAATNDRVLIEAFHYRHHPLFHRVCEVVRSGEIGTVSHIAADFQIPLLRRNDIRYDPRLAGGSTMDLGCYPIHMCRSLMGEEPVVVDATAKLHGPGIDRWMRAQLVFVGGATATVTSSLYGARLLRIRLELVGDAGRLVVLNPVAPQLGHRFVLEAGERTSRETFGRRTSYAYQLDDVVGALSGGSPLLKPPDAIANMSVIDDVYRAAELEPRRSAVSNP